MLLLNILTVKKCKIFIYPFKYFFKILFLILVSFLEISINIDILSRFLSTFYKIEILTSISIFLSTSIFQVFEFFAEFHTSPSFPTPFLSLSVQFCNRRFLLLFFFVCSIAFKKIWEIYCGF